MKALRLRAALAFALSFAAATSSSAGWEAALDPPAGARLLLDAPAEIRRSPIPMRPATGADGPTDMVEGLARWRSFALEDGPAPLAAARRLRAALGGFGFETLLDCAAAECGGFAFLSQIEIASPPDMLVNLADFHQITMRREGVPGGATLVSALFSRMGPRLHGQIVWIATAGAAPDAAVRRLAPTAPDVGEDADALARRLGALLDAQGFAALDGLDFVAGSTEIAASAGGVLDAAAAALAARPGLAVAVVGHTDASGGLAANLDVSRARAAAVVAALVLRGVAPERLSAEGVGWLAPRASNADAAGRAANRRVELVAR